MRRRLRCQTNRCMHLLDRSLHRLLQPRTVAQHQQTFTGLTSGLPDRFHRLTRALLQRDDVRLDVAGRALCLARQRPNFVCHNSETPPGFACPCRFDCSVQCQQVGLLGDPVNDRQHHFNLLTLLREPLDDFRPRVDLPGQRLDQTADLGRRAGVLISGLTDIDHLLQRCLHRVAFRLGLVRHLRKRPQTFRDFVTLHPGRRIGTGIAQGHRADFHTCALGHITRLTHDRLQLVDKAVDCCRHVTDLVLAVDLYALGQVTLARRKVVHRCIEHLQAVDHAMA